MSARLLAAVWIIALIVTPFGFGTVNARPPDLAGPANRTDEMLPEKRPADLRPLMRNLLIGLHPAAGLVSVNRLVDVDDEESVPVLRLRDLPERILQFLGIRGADTTEGRIGEIDPKRFICGLTPVEKNSSSENIPAVIQYAAPRFFPKEREESALAHQIIGGQGFIEVKPIMKVPVPDAVAKRYGCEEAALFALLDRFYGYLYSDDFEVIAPDNSPTWLTGVPLFGEPSYPKGAMAVDIGSFCVRKKKLPVAARSEAAPSRVQCTCPYLNQLQECSPVPRDSALSCDFEENLKKLTAASTLYQKGLTHLRDGNREGALGFFAQIHKLVPGSRYDSQAIEQMDRMKRDELTPTLPPIDPKIVDALQKVLKESGDPTVPRLIIHVEDQPASEEQEPVVPSEWSGDPQDAEIPRLLVDPVADKLTITPEDEEPAESEELSSEAWSALLREVIDALRGGLSEPVERTAGPTSVSHSEHFGGIEVEITIGSGGEQYVQVSLSPEASGDLRAAQWAHNERILRWIESMNEPCADENDAAAEEEDANYGDEPRNEAIP